jgi:hypothetical protein
MATLVANKAICTGGMAQDKTLSSRFNNEYEKFISQDFDSTYRNKIIAQFNAGN